MRERSIYTGVTYHEHAEVGGVASHTKYGSLEVLLVAGQVNECDDLGGPLTDAHPVQTTYRQYSGQCLVSIIVIHNGHKYIS